MKKKTIIICIAVIFVMVCGLLIGRIFIEENTFREKPFGDLSATDVLSISVFAIPPDETVVVENTEQIEEIVSILNTVVTYQKGSDWKNSAGQMVTFTITKTTGAVVEVSAYNPFLIINGQGYKTEYQPCENLNRIANTVLDTRFGGQPIE